ncbi:hypothetical protein ONE63_010235 [Megalurothrips usitatus]|uniref:Uncharacterized protein n=1 Tax=Megalurothrips usitatus TaxID=439358 RepID=A0AAV7XNW6_9NEOP|nr:hypothetical protein ONE63_010235 [Megalurothrips usitatus]
MDPRFITPANNHSEAVVDESSNQKGRYGADFIDFLSVLHQFNCERLIERKVPGTLPFQVLTSKVVDFVFHICSRMNLPTEVKYVALEIFDRFCVHHFTDLWEHTCEVSCDEYQQMKVWKRITSRSQKQALLRAISSIQIASKFVLQSNCLTVKDVQEYLNKWGHAYNLHSIHLSEIRVFSTIGCKVPLYSMFDFTRTFLEGLQYWSDVDELYPTCEKVLEVAFLQRDEIYLRFFWMGTSRWHHSRQERLQFAEIEVNNLFFGASIVVCSVYIHQLEGLGPNEASRILSELSHISSSDITALAVVIAQLISGTRTVRFKACE